MNMMRLSPEAEEAMKARDIENRRCSGCVHFKVCKVPPVMQTVIPGLFPPLKEGDEMTTTSPIDPMDIAKVCAEYMKASGVLTT